MKKIFLLLVLSSVTLFSQQKISKKLGDFNEVKVFSGLMVKLIKISDDSTQNYVEIKGSNSEDVVVNNVNGLLKISVLFPKAFDSNNTFVKLYYTKNLDLIDANEGSIITSDKKITQDFIEIRAQEGAQIELNLNVNTLKVKTISGGNIALSGKVTNQTVIANTGGIYEGFNLQSKQGVVSSSTGAEVEVNVSDILNAKAKLRGFIYYLKEPKKIIKKSIIGGIIKSNSRY